MTDLDVLEGCPFCGSAPVYAPANPEDQGDAWSRLSCVSVDCPAKPVVTVYDDDRDFHVREVGRLWNTRAPSPAARERDAMREALETLETERKRDGVNLAHLKRAIAVQYAALVARQALNTGEQS